MLLIFGKQNANVPSYDIKTSESVRKAPKSAAVMSLKQSKIYLKNKNEIWNVHLFCYYK